MVKRKVEVEVGSKFDGRGFKEAERGAGSLDKKLSGLGKAVSAAGTALLVAIPAGAIAAGKALFTLGQDFASLDAQIAVATGATGAALADLQDVSRDVLRDVPESFEVVGAAIGDFNTFLGATGLELELLTEKTLAWERIAGDIDTAQLSQVANIFNRDVRELTGDMELLFDVTQAYGLPAGKLVGLLQEFGPLFDNAGFSMSETAVFFGQLNKAGIDFTRAGPGINALLRDLAASNAAGESSFATVREEFEAYMRTIQNSENQALGLTFADAAFGAEGAQRIFSAAQSGIIDIDNLFVDVEGSIDDAAEASETFSQKWATIVNQIKVEFEPLATLVFDGVIDKLEKISGWMDEIRLQVAGRDGSIDPASAFDLPKLQTAEQTMAAMANADRVKAWDDLKASFGGFVDDVAMSLGKDGGLQLLLDWGDHIARQLTLAFDNIGKSWIALVAVFKNGITGGVVVAFRELSGILQNTADMIGNIFGVDNASEMFRSWYETGIAWVSTFAENAMAAFRNLHNMIRDVFSGLNPFRPGGVLRNLIPGNADGVNNFSGGLSLVGERGPELVNLPRGSDVIPANRTRQMMGGSGMTVNVHVAGSVLSERGLTDAINDALRRGNRIA